MFGLIVKQGLSLLAVGAVRRLLSLREFHEKYARKTND
jgi:hypothetical protein